MGYTSIELLCLDFSPKLSTSSALEASAFLSARRRTLLWPNSRNDVKNTVYSTHRQVEQQQDAVEHHLDHVCRVWELLHFLDMSRLDGTDGFVGLSVAARFDGWMSNRARHSQKATRPQTNEREGRVGAHRVCCAFVSQCTVECACRVIDGPGCPKVDDPKVPSTGSSINNYCTLLYAYA